MRPIPLPPLVETGVSVSEISLIMLLTGIGLVALAAVGLILGIKFGLEVFSQLGVILGVVGLVPGILGGSFYFNPPKDPVPSYSQLLNQEADHDRLVQKAVEKEYGLKLTEGQARVLDYPTKAPKDDFRVYGSFKDQKPIEGSDFGFESRTVYLVWSKDRLGLAESTDGESFTPITTKQEAK